MTVHPLHRFEVVVVGGGQAGLAMGYELARQGRNAVILDAGERIGDAWRNRWDSLRLFTPAFHSGLPGMPFPGPGRAFPTKDETADYLEAYARRFSLPVRLGRRVESLTRTDAGYLLVAGDERYAADRVVVATGPFQRPRVPRFADRLDPAIAQMHSRDYRNPRQLPAGDVLVVGAANSGAEIAYELAASRRVVLAGRDTGSVRLGLIHNRVSLWLADHVLTVDNRLGRRMRDAGHGGSPLVRVTTDRLAGAGVERAPRVEGVEGGFPRLADGRTLSVASIVWATGFEPDYGWIDLPIFGPDGYPIHRRGVVADAPGLYVLGLPFQSSPTSTHVGGVGRDARYLARQIAAQSTVRRTPARSGELPEVRTA